MNVLCVDQFANFGGGQRSLIDLLPEFAKRGWRPSVAAPGDGPFPDMVRKLGYRAYNLAYGEYGSVKKPVTQILKYTFRLPGVASRLHDLVRALDIELLYVNGPRLVPPAAWVARRTGIRMVFHCHNRLHQQSAIALTARSLGFANARVIACCEHAAIPLKRHVNRERLSIIYNGVKPVTDGPRWLPAQLRRIGVIGRIEPEKGQLEFVKAARLVVNEIPDCRFVITGAPMFSNDLYFKQVIEASKGLPAEFPGWRTDPSRAFSGLDLLVVPSTPLEATTRVILEAYSAGIPVVAFPSGGIPEILQDGETGFLASDVTPEALARRILSVLKMDVNSVAETAARARQSWCEHFRLDVYRKKVCEVLTEP
ncbi:MAG: glycosyltransferase family 4 protein [Bryobacteraceae bacterium]